MIHLDVWIELEIKNKTPTTFTQIFTQICKG